MKTKKRQERKARKVVHPASPKPLKHVVTARQAKRKAAEPLNRDSWISWKIKGGFKPDQSYTSTPSLGYDSPVPDGQWSVAEAIVHLGHKLQCIWDLYEKKMTKAVKQRFVIHIDHPDKLSLFNPLGQNWVVYWKYTPEFKGKTPTGIPDEVAAYLAHKPAEERMERP